MQSKEHTALLVPRGYFVTGEGCLITWLLHQKSEGTKPAAANVHEHRSPTTKPSRAEQSADDCRMELSIVTLIIQEKKRD